MFNILLDRRWKKAMPIPQTSLQNAITHEDNVALTAAQSELSLLQQQNEQLKQTITDLELKSLTPSKEIDTLTESDILPPITASEWRAIQTQNEQLRTELAKRDEQITQLHTTTTADEQHTTILAQMQTENEQLQIKLTERDEQLAVLESAPKEVADNSAELESLQAEIDQLKLKLDDTITTLTNTQTDLQTAKTALDDAQSAHAETADTAKLKTQLAEQTTRAERLQAKLETINTKESTEWQQNKIRLESENQRLRTENNTLQTAIQQENKQAANIDQLHARIEELEADIKEEHERRIASECQTQLVTEKLTKERIQATQFVPQESIPKPKPTTEPETVAKSAPKTKSAASTSKVVKNDDLAEITGLGRTFKKRLNDNGVHTFAQLAELSVTKLEEYIQPQTAKQPDYKLWIKEAKEFKKRK